MVGKPNRKETVMSSTKQMERLFRELHMLLKNGSFTELELTFMESFLEKALEMTRKLLRKAESKKGSG
jgi:hypothetical protein